jgi:site-specific recombinase XerD
MATIHKRRLRSGEIVWELTHGTGRDRQRLTVGRTREEAQTILKQFEHQIALHGGAPTNDSVVAVVQKYEEFLKTNRRPSSVARYVRVVKTFHDCFLVKYFPDITLLRQLRPMHLEEYKRRRSEGEITQDKTTEEKNREQALRLLATGRRKEGTPKERAKFGWLGHRGIQRKVSPRTINYELRTLGTFFLWSIKRNYLFLNPAAPVERFRLSKRVLPKFMTSEELKKFFGACKQDDRRLFMSILLTGMRKGEVEHLCWSDISFELGVIFIQEKPAMNWKPKTDERIIPISPLLHEILLLQVQHRRSELLVFANQQGNRDTHILERLKNICRHAGIKPSTVHALRHSFGAHLRMAGASLADIGDLLGHRDLATTQIYAKVQQDHLRQVISKLTPLAGTVGPVIDVDRRLPKTTNTSDDESTIALSQQAVKPPQ